MRENDDMVELTDAELNDVNGGFEIEQAIHAAAAAVITPVKHALHSAAQWVLEATSDGGLY
jgi:hypothetical protein